MQIAIVLYPGFTALDFIGPYEVPAHPARRRGALRLARAGPDHRRLRRAASSAPRTRSTKRPLPTSFWCPAAFTTLEHARDEKVLDWVRRAHETATWTASVCSGSIILAAAGLLEGKRATSHWAALPALKALGVKPVGDERIVHEGDDRDLRGRVGGHRPRAVAGRPDRRRGPGQGHPAVDGVRPAAAVRLRPHVEGVGDHQGGRHRADVARIWSSPTQLKAATRLLWDHAIIEPRPRRD